MKSKRRSFRAQFFVSAKNAVEESCRFILTTRFLDPAQRAPARNDKTLTIFHFSFEKLLESSKQAVFLMLVIVKIEL
jgi:hypothetical protein